MNKRFLSIFFAGLMIFINSPLCSLAIIDPKHSDYADKEISVDVDLSPVQFVAETGLHIATQSMEVTNIRPIQQQSSLEISGRTFNGNQNLNENITNLDTDVAIAYVSDSENRNPVKVKMTFAAPDVIDNEKKNDIIQLLRRLDKLKFEIKSIDSNGRLQSLYTTGVLNVNNSGTYFENSNLQSVDLTPMKPDEVGETNDQTVKLIMTLSVNNGSIFTLSDAVQIISNLEELGYRFLLQGEILQ